MVPELSSYPSFRYSCLAGSCAEDVSKYMSQFSSCASSSTVRTNLDATPNPRQLRKLKINCYYPKVLLYLTSVLRADNSHVFSLRSLNQVLKYQWAKCFRHSIFPNFIGTFLVLVFKFSNHYIVFHLWYITNFDSTKFSLHLLNYLEHKFNSIFCFLFFVPNR